jgi:hypothetical protein
MGNALAILAAWRESINNSTSPPLTIHSADVAKVEAEMASLRREIKKLREAIQPLARHAAELEAKGYVLKGPWISSLSVSRAALRKVRVLFPDKDGDTP